ncbi:hypothetical protein BDQ17DRAFT_1377612 [Cyathus striatus]|nr:hypothetical protein BDQ17DRAFT_1377612 [Cyathus striatus]
MACRCDIGLFPSLPPALQRPPQRRLRITDGHGAPCVAKTTTPCHRTPSSLRHKDNDAASKNSLNSTAPSPPSPRHDDNDALHHEDNDTSWKNVVDTTASGPLLPLSPVSR